MPPPPQIIDTDAALAAWAQSLGGAELLAIDTESDSFHHYREKVCLVQITALGQDVIIDPLRCSSLQPLAPILADARVKKIFHDAGYDLLCLRRDFGFEVVNLFDTMQASRLLGLTQFGLGAILGERFGFAADKKQQRSDWAQRPLSAAQLDYARYDTHFLPQLYVQLRDALVAKGRLAWAEEDFARLPQASLRLAERVVLPPEQMFWRITGARGLGPEERGRLQALAALRERLAQQLDRPAFRIFNDALLLLLARQAPRSLRELQPQAGLREGGIRRFGPALIDALQAAQPHSGEPPPGALRKRRNGRMLEPQAKERYEALRQLRRQLATGLGLEPDVALSNALLETLARQPPRSPAELQARPELIGWRAPLFVDPLFEVLRGPAVPAAAAPATAAAHKTGPRKLPAPIN